MDKFLRNLIDVLTGKFFNDFNVDIESDRNRRIVLGYVFAVLGLIIFLISLIYSIINRYYFLAITDIVMIIILSLMIILSPRGKNYKKIHYITVGALACYFIALYLITEYTTTALLWYPLFPVISILVIGRKHALNFSISLIVITLALYILGQFIPILPSYDYGFMISFFPAYITIMLIAYYADVLRHNVTKKLIKTNEELESAQEKLFQLSNMDKLSGLYNRNYLESCCEKTLFKENVDGDVSILMIDIDYFKAYNDAYGHLLGDEVIKKVSAAIKSCCTDNDILIRYGGEEFIAILINRNYNEAISIAYLMLESVRKLNIEHKSSNESIVTVSIGIASFKDKFAESKYVMIEKADKAMYKAKRKGKNCCVY